ncbi:hypothetical protein FGO68_gene4602 [Halteria grandinella]|uniref:Uncharacterized protein n=1 Tax=Halteria grandinella TaxID=5974 RepID=A0A8J8NL06_HALGN|nr:hypothetical protein FGO68_gene4602 [Halteria grandinella]
MINIAKGEDKAQGPQKRHSFKLPEGKDPMGERGDQQQAWKPLAINLELQRLDNILYRGWVGFKFFCLHYMKDKFTCPMIIIWLCAIGCAVICWILPYKDVHPVKGLKLL